ncbi:MAG: tRNA (mo5U34)-methyltransferase [Flavobacteriales bacterium]|jgi:tRNA (mo5U34)-methyltransferase
MSERLNAPEAWREHLRALGREELVAVSDELDATVAPWRADHETILRRILDVSPAEIVRLDEAAPRLEPASIEGPHVASLLTECIPWRKGPWRIGSTLVDAEWRSDLKWGRLQECLGDCGGLSVCDVGSGNGYSMARLLGQKPSFVLGIDPQPLSRLQWELVSRLVGAAPWRLVGWRADALARLPRAFDRILCAGLLYHVGDPVGLLRDMRTALAPGGQVIVETIVIPGDDPIAWHPPGRYSGARGFYALPTRSCLAGWLRRAGLTKQQWRPAVKTTEEEQRATPWTHGPGISAGLDPQNDQRTIEGLPAPWRVVVSASAE